MQPIFEYWQVEQRCVAWRAEQVPSAVCLDATPERDTRRTESTRLSRTCTVASPQAGPLLHAAVRRRFWPQPRTTLEPTTYEIWGWREFWLMALSKVPGLE